MANAAIRSRNRRNRLYASGLCGCGKQPRMINSKRCSECVKAEANRYHSIREFVINAYGGQCAICAESIIQFLTIDHIDGGGCQHLRSIRTPNLTKWLYARDCPSGFQVLCWNHNFLKHRNNRVLDNKSILKLRNEIFLTYGSQCQCCGMDDVCLLTIDHPNNNGASERRSLNIPSGYYFYRWLRQNGFPSGYNVLCFNCNSGRNVNGGTCPHAQAKVTCKFLPIKANMLKEQLGQILDIGQRFGTGLPVTDLTLAKQEI